MFGHMMYNKNMFLICTVKSHLFLCEED